MAPTAARGLAQTLDATPEPSARRGYCGLPTREEAACPYTSGGYRTSAIALLDDLESRTRIRTAASTRRDVEGRRRESTLSQSLVAQVAQRARHLQAYWQNFGTPISATTFDAGVLAHQLPYLPELNNEHRETALALLDMVLHDSLLLADATIRQERDVTTLSEAAALWWTARFFQIQLACPNETTPTESPFRQWAEQQSELQSCRRQYLEEASARIDAAVRATHAERLRLNSREWNLIWMLGSRRERGQALLNILPRLHLNEGTAPPDLAVPEVYFLGRHLLQVISEKAQGQALTWNGYQPAEPEDLQLFDQEILALQRTFVTLIQVTQNLRESVPALYQAVRRTWTAVFPALPAETWNRLGWDEDSPMGLGWEQECNEGVAAACDLWLRKHTVGSVAEWEALLLGADETRQTGRQNGIRLTSWLTILPVYHQERDAARGAARREWDHLHRQLGERLAHAYRDSLGTPPPSIEDLDRCLTSDEWIKWTTGSVPLIGASQIQLRDTCASGSPANTRNWIFHTLVMLQILPPQNLAWQDNLAALWARYGAWLRQERASGSSSRDRENAHEWLRAHSESRHRSARRSTVEIMMDEYGASSSPWRLPGFERPPEAESMNRALRLFSLTPRDAVPPELLNDPLL